MKKGVILCGIILSVLLLGFVSADPLDKYHFGDWFGNLFSGDKQVSLSESTVGQAVVVGADKCGAFTLNSPIKAKANSEYSSKYSAGNTIDGNYDNFWFGKYDGFPKIITFDLGEKKCMDSIETSFYLNIQPITFNIEVSDDEINWYSVKKNFVFSGGKRMSISTSQKINFVGPVVGRYLRIYETANGRGLYGSLTEMKIDSGNYIGSSRGNSSTTTVNNSCQTVTCATPQNNCRYVGPFIDGNNCGTCGTLVCDSIQQTEVDKCSSLSDDVKRKIFELQNQNYSRVILREGAKANVGDYVVLPSGENETTIIVVNNVINKTIGYSNDKINFRDVPYYRVYPIVINSEGKGHLTISGEYYNISYGGRLSEENNWVKITWGDKSKSGGLYSEGSEIDTSEGCNFAPKCLDSNGLDNYYGGYGETRIKNNGSKFRDYCDGDYVMDSYCDGDKDHGYSGGEQKFKRRFCEFGCDESSWDSPDPSEKVAGCFPAQKVCESIDFKVKEKIIELQNNGENVTLLEGKEILSGNYFVISQNGNSRLLKFVSLNRVGGNLSVLFEDVINGERFESESYSYSNEDRQIEIDGERYNLYFEKYRIGRGLMRISWGENSSFTNNHGLFIDVGNSLSEVCLDNNTGNGGSSSCSALDTELNGTNEIYQGYSISGIDKRRVRVHGQPMILKKYNFISNSNKDKGIEIMIFELEDKSLFMKDSTYLTDILVNERISGEHILSSRVYSIENYMLWPNGNKLIAVGVYDNNNNNNKKISADYLANKLKNSGFEGLTIDPSSEEHNILRRVSMRLLSSCESKIDENQCLSNWAKKTEPVVCPEYGRQTIITSDLNGCNPKIIKEEIRCSPGVCSGCYVPRWMGYNSIQRDKNADNVCVPYTIRLAQEKKNNNIDGITEGYYEENNLAWNLTIISDGEARLEFIRPDGSMDREYMLIVGQKTEVDTSEFENRGGKITLDITGIRETEDGKREVLFRAIKNFNGYCDIDGRIKKQKVKDYQGNWASCQNNYECESNLCSAGECVEIKDAISQSGAIKGLFYRILCRLGNLFDNQNFDQCLYDNLGQQR